MIYKHWYYASSTKPHNSALLYFSDDEKLCDFRFDLPSKHTGKFEWDVPRPLRDYDSLVRSLFPYADDHQVGITEMRVCCELLQLHVIGEPIPTDSETGIDRYFREHPEAA